MIDNAMPLLVSQKYADLQDRYNFANGLDPNDYPSSWAGAGLDTAISDAKDLLDTTAKNDVDATPTTGTLAVLTAAKVSLDTAIAKLTELDDLAKAEDANKIDKMSEFNDIAILDEGNYSAASWANYQKVLDSDLYAKVTADTANATSADVGTLIDQLTGAGLQLETKAWADLKNTISYAKALSSSSYTEDEWFAMQDKLAAAQTALDGTDKGDIDADSLTALTDARTGLKDAIGDNVFADQTNNNGTTNTSSNDKGLDAKWVGLIIAAGILLIGAGAVAFIASQSREDIEVVQIEKTPEVAETPKTTKTRKAKTTK